MSDLAKTDAIREHLLKVMRPKIQADGGDFRIVNLSASSMDLCFTGQCANCPATEHLVPWIREELAQRFDLHYKINASFEVPYFFK
jgi:Fe-S cluster biogenesis protein NfuA